MTKANMKAKGKAPSGAYSVIVVGAGMVGIAAAMRMQQQTRRSDCSAQVSNGVQ